MARPSGCGAGCQWSGPPGNQAAPAVGTLMLVTVAARATVTVRVRAFAARVDGEGPFARAGAGPVMAPRPASESDQILFIIDSMPLECFVKLHPMTTEIARHSIQTLDPLFD